MEQWRWTLCEEFKNGVTHTEQHSGQQEDLRHAMDDVANTVEYILEKRVKSDFYIDRVDKEYSKNLLYNYHYLKDESKDFKSGYNYGLFRHTDWDCPLNIGGCLAVCIFTEFPVPEIAKGAFGLERNQQEGLFELSRLCVDPELQREEYNITSWFVSRCIKRFRKDANVRAILSYADSAHHSGIIYKAFAILHTMD